MDDKKRENIFRYGAVCTLAGISFWVSYISITNKQAPPTKTARDGLSGEQYTPIVDEENPFGPYFVGFDTLIDRGVSRENLGYIYDVLTNFTMYKERLYAAKVSYVADSFERQSVSGITPKYSFEFGINDKNIHQLKVESSILTQDITISIFNRDTQVFNRTFHIYPTD